MSCTCQRTIEVLRSEFDAAFPGRDKASDGCCASATHTAQNPDSGHEGGIAGDIDADLRGGMTMHDVTRRVAAAMLAGLVPQCDYIIYNRQIFNPEIAPFWRPYHGSNDHKTHAHFEGLWDYRNYTGSWMIRGGDELVGEQADRIERKLDQVLERMARQGVLARMNARIKSIARRETRRTEANAAGRR